MWKVDRESLVLRRDRGPLSAMLGALSHRTCIQAISVKGIRGTRTNCYRPGDKDCSRVEMSRWLQCFSPKPRQAKHSQARSAPEKGLDGEGAEAGCCGALGCWEDFTV